MKGKKIVASLALALGAFSGLVACDKTEEKPEVKDPVTYTVIFKSKEIFIKFLRTLLLLKANILSVGMEIMMAM